MFRQFLKLTMELFTVLSPFVIINQEYNKEIFYTDVYVIKKRYCT